MIFQKKDLDTWDRAEIFCHFIDELRCVMSMTVELDVTAFVNALKKRGLFILSFDAVGGKRGGKPAGRIAYGVQCTGRGRHMDICFAVLRAFS